jgi:ABC-type arginine transport system ATPase subunit
LTRARRIRSLGNSGYEWAADAEGGAPYIFKDPKNPAVNIGFEVDLAAALEKELGRRIEWQQYDFRSPVSGLNRGDFEFAMNGLEITADRAKVMEPRGLLCDEITSALDPDLKGEVLGVLEGLKRDGLTLVVVTHEMGFARRAADRIVVLDEGRVIEAGPPGEILDHPQTARTRQFLSQVLA